MDRNRFPLHSLLARVVLLEEPSLNILQQDDRVFSFPDKGSNISSTYQNTWLIVVTSLSSRYFCQTLHMINNLFRHSLQEYLRKRKDLRLPSFHQLNHFRSLIWWKKYN